MTSLSNLNTSLAGYNNAVVSKLAVKSTAAASADNALKLEGKTLSELTNDANATINSHINNRQNPHGLTASAIGAYTIGEIEARYANFIPPDVVPISFFGNTETNLVQSVNAAGLVVSLIANIPAMVAGRFVKMGGFSFNCTPNGKTWLYIGINQLTLAYSTSFGDVPLPETQTKMLIGCVVAQNSTIVSHWVKPMRRIDVTPIPRVPDLTNRHRICSLGYVQTLYPTTEVGYWRENIKVLTATRGYQVAVLHPSTGYVYRTDQFDTYSGLSEINRMTAFLNAIPAGYLTIIYGYDEVASGGVVTNTNWINAMLNLGAPTGFQNQLRSRCAHVLLGKQNAGANNSNNFIGGTVDNASDAVVDVNFHIVSNAFTNVQRTV